MLGGEIAGEQEICCYQLLYYGKKRESGKAKKRGAKVYLWSKMVYVVITISALTEKTSRINARFYDILSRPRLLCAVNYICLSLPRAASACFAPPQPASRRLSLPRAASACLAPPQLASRRLSLLRADSFCLAQPRSSSRWLILSYSASICLKPRKVAP